MNYSKKNVSKKTKELSSKNAKVKKKFNTTFLKTLLLCLLGLFIVGMIGGTIYAKHLIDQCPDIADIDISPNGFSTTVLDNQGNEIESLAASGANRQYVPIEEIPEDLQDAFVAIEDERFYQHNGIDLRGIARAVVTSITSGGKSMQGASTITQQLLKNNVFTTWMSEKTLLDRVNRKIQEQYLAIQLEKYTDKKTILENYLNTINLGQNTLGVQAASERYFNKNATDLTLSESATIAAITQNPSRYNPISNPEENEKRRKRVLDKMLEQGKITKTDYDNAIDDDVYDRIQIVNNQTQSSGSTSYFVDALTDQVIDDLVEQKGYTETEAYQLLYSGGLTIHSTQDTRIQNIVTEELNDPKNYSPNVEYSFSWRLTVTKADGSTKNYSDQTMLAYYQAQNPSYNINYPSVEACEKAIEDYKAEILEEGDTVGEGCETVTFTLQPQAAMTIMDHSTGSVVALVGGRGEKTASKTLNRATNITRQPGSTFKVVAVYAAALDAGGMTLASVQDDAPMTYTDGKPLVNYDDLYQGLTTIRKAIEHSINTVTVKTLTDIGTGLGYEYAKNLGITTLESGDNNQSLALGGITNGVTNLDLCNAYSTIANHGKYHKPIFYTEVYDHSGELLLDNKENPEKEILKETTAWLLTNAMQDVMTSGTGVKANFSGMSVAGKSGTTSKRRDTLFAGFTPYYTCAVWGGYDDNSVQSYISYSKVLWKACMERIHEGLSDPGFPQPPGIVTAEVCRKSGKLPIPGVCDADPRGSMVYTEFFAEGTVPTETCDHHIAVDVCTTSNMVAGTYCPSSSVQRQIFIINGSNNAGDAFHLLPEHLMNGTCTTHTSAPMITNPITSITDTITDGLNGNTDSSNPKPNETVPNTSDQNTTPNNTQTPGNSNGLEPNTNLNQTIQSITDHIKQQ